MTKSTVTFAELGLAEPILRALTDEGYTAPTPIQAQAIPLVLGGRDLLGIAQTGTGKTAAFALPILNHLEATPRPLSRGFCRALILSPTRELASQIAESFRTYSRHMRVSVTTVFGGVPFGAQIRALQRGVDILVATPGRLQDHMRSGHIDLSRTEVLVLDEADQMLDLGFIVPIREIVKDLPKQRRSLFFSATMPPTINKLASELLDNPAKVEVTPVASTVDRIEQKVIFIEQGGKRALLADLLRNEAKGRTLVFTRTKHGADAVVNHLEKVGIASDAIHGNRSQSQREKALSAFKSGRAPVLVATDIAARGIDVDGVTHVVNFDLPNVPESYVHRIGRTARAGASGAAISLCNDEERAFLRDIEKLIRRALPNEDRRENPIPIAMVKPKPMPRGGKRPGQAARQRTGGAPGGKSHGAPGGKPHAARPQNAARKRAGGERSGARPG